MQGAFIFHEPVSMIRMAHEAAYDRALATPRQASPSLAMAPHLFFAELNLIAKAAGEQKAPKDIHALISAKRRASKVDPHEDMGRPPCRQGHLRDRTET